MNNCVVLRRSYQRRKKIAALLMLIIMDDFDERQKRGRKFWVKPWISRRKEQGVHHNLFVELWLEDPDKFRRCLRMDTVTYAELLNKVAPLIIKQDTHLRKSIPPTERLSLTLRHLATGESQESLSMSFRIGQSTVSKIIREVCQALIVVLKEEFLRFPSTELEWKAVAQDFGDKWNFFNCVGAIDGKHVRIDPPIQSGSHYYNYKGTFSIVLMAVVDATLRFIPIQHRSLQLDCSNITTLQVAM